MNCKTIRDLLPLYHDEVASEESRALVEEHLKTCAECRKVLEDIQENVSIINVEGMEQSMISGLKVLKKKLSRRTISKIAISVICAVAVVSALIYGALFYETPISHNEATRTITQPINSALDIFTNAWGHNAIDVICKEDALYICFSDTFWTRHIAKPHRQPKFAIFSSIEPEIPDIPDIPEIPEIPEVLGASFNDIPSIPEIPPIPEVPEAPANPLIEIGEATKVFYLQANLRELAFDDIAFTIAAANAVLLWEKQ
jgi:hypothetical protein